jgi:TniQ
MRRSWIPPRQPGPLPEILSAENDEVLSSWLTRSAALYRVRPETLLEQLGISEVVLAALDRRANPMDLERLSVAMRSSPEAIRRMTFTGEAPEALEFVTHRLPFWTCRWCVSEFAAADLAQARLRTWFITVASRCRRCGGQLTPVRVRASRALHNIIADGEPYRAYALVRDRLGHAFETGRPIGAVIRAMRALAAPVPTDNRALYTARKRGRLPYCPKRAPPAPVAAHRDPETSATHAWIPVLAAAGWPALRCLAAGGTGCRDSWSDCPRRGGHGNVGASR